MREPPVAVAVRAASSQSLHPPAEGDVLRPPASARHGGQRAVVQHCGGQETRVTGRILFFAHTGNVAKFQICFPPLLHLNEIRDQCIVFFLCRPGAVSKVASLGGETVAVGVVTCLIVYPLYLLAFTLFRMSRSKVALNPSCFFFGVVCLFLTRDKLDLCVCVSTTVCVSRAGAHAGGPGVGGD